MKKYEESILKYKNENYYSADSAKNVLLKSWVNENP